VEPPLARAHRRDQDRRPAGRGRRALRREVHGRPLRLQGNPRGEAPLSLPAACGFALPWGTFPTCPGRGTLETCPGRGTLETCPGRGTLETCPTALSRKRRVEH